MILSLHRKNGSILVEALLTVVILSVGLTFIIQALTLSLRIIGLIANYSTALMLLENKMFDLLQKGFIAAPFQEQKSVSEPYAQYRYHLDVQKSSSAATEKKNKVDLQVVWGTGLKEKNISLTTYVFDTPHEPAFPK